MNKQGDNTSRGDSLHRPLLPISRVANYIWLQLCTQGVEWEWWYQEGLNLVTFIEDVEKIKVKYRIPDEGNILEL